MRSSWQKTTLGEVCQVYQPTTLSQKQLIPGEYPVYGANGQIGWHNEFNHVDPQLILGCRGSCGSVHLTEPNAWINGNAMVVKPRADVMCREFLAYGLRGGIDISIAITGAAQPQITRASLGPVPISFPPSLQEQHRIVRLLDEAFEGIATAKASAEQNLRNARALFEGYLHAAFTDHHWPVVRLGDLAEKVTKGTTPTSVGYAFVEKGINFVKVESIARTGRFIREKFACISPDCHADLARSQLVDGDILFSIAGALGRTALVTDDILPANTNQALAIIRLRPNPNVLSTFVLRALATGVVLEQIEQFRGGAAQQNLSLAQVRNFEIAMPPLAEQQQIVTNLERLSDETQRLASIFEAKLAALETLKKSLLHLAFSAAL